RASMGDELDDAGLLELQRFFDACDRLDALTRDSADMPRTVSPAVSACASALERGRAGSFGFYLGDDFDAGLASERAGLRQSQAEYDAVRGRSIAAAATLLGREVDGNTFIVMRDDVPGTLPAGIRVVREAPTYVLCELDANEAELAALERRDAAAARVADAESRVRAALSSIVRAHAVALDAAMDTFAIADVLIGGARFTQAYDCRAAVLETGAIFEIAQARFVPLAAALERDGRAFTPIDVCLDGVAVVTGPNMGGKSACLRTCGFAAVCAAYGLPVPARSARMPLYAQVAWLGIGGEDDGGGLLSSFAREVVRLRDVLASKERPRLILLDEFARTTTPREGKALVVAVIARLRAEGATALAATHVDGVAKAAGVTHYAVRGLRSVPRAAAAGDLQAALVTLAASMDYTLEEVHGDAVRGADAIALAALLGIDESVIADAYAALEDI
ncbi:MAG TPA: hypothetical protein VIJ64_10255, partial [Candidatus Lustribacter sp.]